MKYLPELRAAHNSPQQLEQLYHTALQAHAGAEFLADVLACYAEAPDNVLYAAWYYRLQHPAPGEPAEHRSVNWKLAAPLSLLTGLVLWLLSDDRLVFSNQMPYLALLWAPILAVVVLVFLTLTAKKGYERALAVGAALVGITAYVVLLSFSRQHYRELMMLHVPLLAWVAVAVSLMGFRSHPESRFAFLSKSVEVAVTTGVYVIAVFIFAGVTTGMFQALSLRVPDAISRLLFVGGAGLIPIIAVASVYDPLADPTAQDFRRGLSKMVAVLPRLLLPFTVVVLVIYLGFIPFNFMAPFNNRDTLIVYNGMLFAVIGLLLGATPLRADELSPRYQTALRAGILAIAVLVIVVSAYALAAIVYRTVQGGLTLNRLAVIGWNSLNIGLLGLLTYRQFQGGKEKWIESLHATFSLGSVGYFVWAAFLTLALPWLF
ncbi:MAG: rane protein of unknown function [Anaerolineales bacterium]|nr:rane protein of unknown function [Anaerolineales bacterium]